MKNKTQTQTKPINWLNILQGKRFKFQCILTYEFKDQEIFESYIYENELRLYNFNFYMKDLFRNEINQNNLIKISFASSEIDPDKYKDFIFIKDVINTNGKIYLN